MDTFIPFLDSFQTFLARVTVIGGELFREETLMNNCLSGNKFNFLAKKKRVFFCFCRLYVFL